MTINNPQPGAVLSEQLIKDACRSPPYGHGPLVHPAAERCFKSAAYDLRIAADGLVLPSGEAIRVGEPAHKGSLILMPGETAFVSTFEKLDVPRGIVGNISIKGTMARAGLLLLTGAVVDPGWHEAPDRNRDGRLHFAVANIGRDPVALEPGFTKVVTIQFLYVAEPGEVHATTDADDIWETKPKHGLGFVESLAQVKRDVDNQKNVLEAQQRATTVVIVGAIFLLTVTLLGVALAEILSVAGDGKLAMHVKEAIPQTAPERVFVATIVLAAVWGLTVVSWLLVSRRRAVLNGSELDPVQRREREAVVGLEKVRTSMQMLVGSVALTAVILVVELSIAAQVTAGEWWILALAGVVIISGYSWTASSAWTPITESAIRDRERKLAGSADSPSANNSGTGASK
jgi:deoxycytidine triphosphate deaminase